MGHRCRFRSGASTIGARAAGGGGARETDETSTGATYLHQRDRVCRNWPGFAPTFPTEVSYLKYEIAFEVWTASGVPRHRAPETILAPRHRALDTIRVPCQRPPETIPSLTAARRCRSCPASARWPCA